MRERFRLTWDAPELFFIVMIALLLGFAIWALVSGAWLHGPVEIR